MRNFGIVHQACEQYSDHEPTQRSNRNAMNSKELPAQLWTGVFLLEDAVTAPIYLAGSARTLLRRCLLCSPFCDDAFFARNILVFCGPNTFAYGVQVFEKSPELVGERDVWETIFTKRSRNLGSTQRGCAAERSPPRELIIALAVKQTEIITTPSTTSNNVPSWL